MAKDKIEQKDVIDSSIPKTFAELNKELAISVKLMTDLTKTAIDLNKNFDPDNIQQVIDSQKEYNKVNEQSQEQNKETTETLEKLRKKIAQVNEEEERAKIALQEKRKAIRDSIKAQKDQSRETVKLTRELQKEVKTEREAAEQNKRLIKIRKEADTTTAKGAKQVALINKRIDKNNDLIKENASKLGKQKIEIGNYKDGIKDALAEQDFFGVSLNKISAGLKSGVGIVGAISAAVVGLGKAYASSARGAEDMARASDRLNSIAKSLGNSIADASGDVGIFDAFVRKLQTELLGLASTIESDLQVALLSQLRQLGILEKEQERQKKAQLDRAEVQRQIRDDERKSFEERKAANEELGNIINEREKDTVEFQEKILKNLQTLLSLDEGNLELQEQIKQVEFEIADAREEAQGFRSEQLMNDLAMSREFVANEIELQKTILEGRIASAKQGSAEEFNLRLQLIQKTRELELQAAGENEQLQKIAIEKAKNAADELSRVKIDARINENEDILELIEEQNEKELELLDEQLTTENELLIGKEEEKFQSIEELRQEDLAKQKQADEEKKASNKSYIDFAIGQAEQLSNSLFAFQSQELANQQMADIEKAKSRGASEEEIAAIEKKFAEKRKKAAITQAIINTALAVTNALNTQPFFPLGLIMAVLAGAAGAIEIATIKNAKFAKGTKDSGSQWIDATVGEKGTERINFADGTSMLTPDGATRMYLPPHSEVVPNHRLQQDLAEMQMIGRSRDIQRQDDDRRRREENDRLIKALKNRDETVINITEGGFYVMAKKGANRTKYIDRVYRGK